MIAVPGGLGQSLLRRILVRCAIVDSEIGYCQGMGFIVGMLLTYMPEDDAFYTFVSTLEVFSSSVWFEYVIYVIIGPKV